MASKESGDPKPQIHQIVLLIAAVTGGVWFYQNPLISSRPVQGTEIKIEKTMEDERVSARLWQDPFEAVETHVKSEESRRSARTPQSKYPHSHSLSLVATEVATSVPTPRDIQILVILTDGSSYADNRESRLRQRFAVLAGLEQAGYIPRDGEHIRYFDWDVTETCQSIGAGLGHEASRKLQVPGAISIQAISIGNSQCQQKHAGYWHQSHVPVEWYQSVNNSHVLVLWIKDQDLGIQPLNNLRKIQQIVRQGFFGLHPIVSLKIIGPRFSGTLQTMLIEDGTVDGQDRLEIYSPWSTTPEPYLLDHEQKSIEDWATDKNLMFVRTIPTDDLLIHALVDELKRRGVPIGKECTKGDACGHIAVIAEWDTLYGRTLPEIFSAVATNTSATTDNNLPRDESVRLDAKQDRVNWIHRFSYLRGLDGELPQGKPNRSSDEKTSSSPLLNDRRQDIDRLERPEERSQLDYVRRLAQHLRDMDDELRACGLWKSRCPGIKAIGVLGSDVYDKMLILQALKKSFPHVIFFTTDLDARLFHPNELAWTRNLVVASHFDLRLDPKLQGSIPPFRDTYQTATFFTILKALDVLKEVSRHQQIASADKNRILRFEQNGVKQVYDFEPDPQVKLHEIGKNGPVDISVPRHTGEQSSSIYPIQPISTVRLVPLDQNAILRLIPYFFVVTLIAWIFLIPSSKAICNWSISLLQDMKKPLVCLAISLATFGVLLLLLRFLASDSYEGEPFSLLDGVSIWPSQLLRGAVIGLSVLFGWLLYRHSDRTCNQMEKQFPEILKPETLPSDVSSSLMGAIKEVWKAPAQMLIGTWTPGKDAPISMLWGEYRKQLHWTWVLIRVTPVSIAFWVVGQIVLWITGFPFTPFRGGVAWQVNLVLLLPAILGMIGIIFYVLDITQLTSAFTEKLVPEITEKEDSTITFPQMQLIEQLTDRIDKFIYFPAALLALMVMARSEFIDNWDFPIGLMAVIGLSASYVVASAIQLRKASEVARQRVLVNLSRQYRKRYPSDSAEEIRHAIEEVTALSKGAFMPLTQLGVFRAVTWPTGVYAVIALIETFVTN